ncbi:MAG: tetratricopeptide repeat protein [Proteobacteria bacterium]|nr:tetratricopeptide repeat protein [Pseudomonadota bacterium]
MKPSVLMRALMLAAMVASVSGCAGLFGPPEPPAPIEDRANKRVVATQPAPQPSGARAIPLPEQPRLTARPLITKPAMPRTGSAQALPPVTMSDSAPASTPELGFAAEALPPEDLGGAATPPAEASTPEAGGAPPAPALSPAVQSLVNAANDAAAEQNWDRAQAALERAVKLAPSKSSLWHQLAYTHLKSGDLERAREVVQRALSLAANDGHENVAAWRLLGDIEQARGDTGAAQMARANATRLLR